MAQAIIKALLKGRIIPAENITASDVSQQNLERLRVELGIKTAVNNTSAIYEAEIIILAVKPQNLDDLSRELYGLFGSQQLVISILAGTPIARLSASLGHDKIVRAMPNTPAQIGMGMTVWTCSRQVSDKQKQTAETILSSMGEAIFAEEENRIDMATAISGSGPAYFFLFMENLIESAISLGFDSQTARNLVMQTALGSVKYAASSEQDISKLRQQVTSPGGTTAEAIKYFNSCGIKETIHGAVTAAYHKATEMGKY